MQRSRSWFRLPGCWGQSCRKETSWKERTGASSVKTDWKKTFVWQFDSEDMPSAWQIRQSQLHCVPPDNSEDKLEALIRFKNSHFTQTLILWIRKTHLRSSGLAPTLTLAMSWPKTAAARTLSCTICSDSITNQGALFWHLMSFKHKNHCF